MATNLAPAQDGTSSASASGSEVVAFAGGNTDWTPTVTGATVTRGISFGTAGTLIVDMANGQLSVSIPSGALAAGIMHPIEVTKIHFASTAALIMAWY